MITLHDGSNIIVYGMFNSLPILWFLKNQVLLCKKVNLKKVNAPKSNSMQNAIAIIILACVVWGKTIQYFFPWGYPVFSDFRILLCPIMQLNQNIYIGVVATWNLFRFCWNCICPRVQISVLTFLDVAWGGFVLIWSIEFHGKSPCGS